MRLVADLFGLPAHPVPLFELPFLPPLVDVVVRVINRVSRHSGVYPLSKAPAGENDL